MTHRTKFEVFGEKSELEVSKTAINELFLRVSNSSNLDDWEGIYLNKSDAIALSEELNIMASKLKD